VQDVRVKHRAQIDSLSHENDQFDRLCELNVIEQVVNVCQTTVVKQAWSRGQRLSVHGWIYRLTDGLLRDIGMSVTSEAELLPGFETACARRVGG
jgi:carbonic anhydrase